MAFYRRDRIFDDDSPVHQFFSQYMPIVHYPGVGTVLNVPPGDTTNATALEQLRTCFVVRRYNNLMLNPVRPRVLPRGLRLGRYFANIQNEAQLEHMIVGEYPWLHASRFIRLGACACLS